MPWKFFSLIVLLLAASIPGAAAARVLQPNDRIVFVGDSITGQGGNSPQGWVHLIGDSIKDIWPKSNLTLLPLGGSGQTVGSWINVEQKSHDIDRALDVPGVMVKTTLDQPADVLIVMLGMNDVLSVSTTDRPEDIAAWAGRYRTLLGKLRDRLHPRVVALATVTMATEDPQSPKNKLGAMLNEQSAVLAKEQGCLFLPTSAAMLDMLRTGRTWRPDFHVTGDYVHPSAAGHVSIALGMLQGLQEVAAAESLKRKLMPAIRGEIGDLQVSFKVEPKSSAVTDREQSFVIKYWVNGKLADEAAAAKVTIAVPDRWRVEQIVDKPNAGEFQVNGEPDRLNNVLKLEASANGQQKSVDIVIPAPWLIATGIDNRTIWTSGKYTPEKGVLPTDATVSRGELSGVVPATLPTAPPATWRRYFATVDYTGGNNSASIDYWSDTIGRTYEAGYAVRWIYSPKARDVQLDLNSGVFAGVIGLTSWVNGKSVYAGLITGETGKKTSVTVSLKEGWNCLAVKSNHLSWQWQVGVDLRGMNNDDLADLRYSTVSPSKQ